MASLGNALDGVVDTAAPDAVNKASAEAGNFASKFDATHIAFMVITIVGSAFVGPLAILIWGALYGYWRFM